MTTLKEPQASLAEKEEIVPVTIALMLHQAPIYRIETNRKPLLKKN